MGQSYDGKPIISISHPGAERDDANDEFLYRLDKVYTNLKDSDKMISFILLNPLINENELRRQLHNISKDIQAVMEFILSLWPEDSISKISDESLESVEINWGEHE